MSEGGIPAEVEDLLVRHIDSVDDLEVLLLTHGNAAVAWSAGSIAQALRIAEGSAAARLARLTEHGLLTETQEGASLRYQFAADRPTIQHAVSALAQAYRERRVAVITKIYSKPNDQIRTFADAFKLRRDK